MRKLLTAVPFAAYVWTTGIVAALAGVTGFIVHERQVGALNEKVRTVEVEREAATAHADSMLALARIATENAKDSVYAARLLVAHSQALQAATRRAAALAGSERAAAERVLADSLASVVALRGELTRLVAVSRSDSAASSAQHQADTQSIRGLLAAIQADSTAADRQRGALGAVMQRALGAEREVQLLKKLRPSVIVGIVHRKGAAGAVIAAVIAAIATAESKKVTQILSG